MTNITDDPAHRVASGLDAADLGDPGVRQDGEAMTMTMTAQSKTLLFGHAAKPTTLMEEVAMPILLGGLIGLGTGGIIWMMAVVHFGLMRWMWP